MCTLDQNIWRSNIRLLWKPSCASIIHVFYPYSYMALRHGRRPWYYQRRSSRWTSSALGGFWMSIGQNLSKMTRYVLVLGSRSCPTLSAAAVCPSLDTCTAPTPHKTITVLYKPALWVLLMIGDWGLAVPYYPGYKQWRLTCDQWTSDWRRRSGVLRSDRHGGNSYSNGYVYDKLPKKKIMTWSKHFVHLPDISCNFHL